MEWAIAISVVSVCVTYAVVTTQNRPVNRPFDKPVVTSAPPIDNLNSAYDALLDIRKRLDEAEHRLEDLADWMVSPHVVQGVDTRLSLQPMVDARISLRRAFKELKSAANSIRDARVSRKTLPPPVNRTVLEALENVRRPTQPGELALVPQSRTMIARLDLRKQAEATNPIRMPHTSGRYSDKQAEADWVRSIEKKK